MPSCVIGQRLGDLDRLRKAGFRDVGLVDPILPADYDGPDADRLQVERTRPPYTIYVARK